MIDHLDSSKSYIRKYIYSGDNIVAEMDGANRMLASYTHSPLSPDDLLAVHFTNHAVPNANGGDALSDEYVLSQVPGNFYYLKDHLNTVTDIINGQGNIVQSYNYSSFGVLRGIKDSNGADLNFKSAPIRTHFTFTSREHEQETGFYYYRARYYDPSVGRFLQVDPDPGKLGDPRTFLSKYIYAGNNPVMFSDPSGRLAFLFPMIVGAIIGGIIGGLDAALNGGNFSEKFLRGMIGGALFGFAFAINPMAASISLGTSLFKAGSQNGNFFANLNNNIIEDGALAVVASSVAESLRIISQVNVYVPLFTIIPTAAFYLQFYLIPKTALDIVKIGCDKENGSWSRGDLCKF